MKAGRKPKDRDMTPDMAAGEELGVVEELLGRGERIVIPEEPWSRQYADHRGPTQDGLHIQGGNDDIRAYAEILSRPRTGGDFELDQDDFQPYQDGIKTKTKATGGNETDGRTGGDFEGGQGNSQLYQDGDKNNRTGGDFELYQDGFQCYQDKITTDLEGGQDDFQLHQERTKTETKATGRDETDTRTGGNLKLGQDDFQLHQDGNKTNRTSGDFELYQDDFQHYLDEIKTGTKATGRIETDVRTGGNFKLGQDTFQLEQDGIKTKATGTGGVETDARTGGDFKHDKTNRTSGKFEL